MAGGTAADDAGMGEFGIAKVGGAAASRGWNQGAWGVHVAGAARQRSGHVARRQTANGLRCNTIKSAGRHTGAVTICARLGHATVQERRIAEF